MSGDPATPRVDPARVDAPAGADREIDELLGKLHRIPDAARTFSISAEHARLHYSLGPRLLDRLVARGLPNRDGVAFDLVDIMNIALHLGHSPAARAARRFWSAGLNRPAGAPPVEYDIDYRPACPVPGHPGPCNYRVVLAGDRTVLREAVPEQEEPLTRLRVTLADDWPALPEAARDLLDETRGLDFFRLPAAVRWDVEFIRRSGISDCAGAATMLCAEGRRRGLPTRAAHGLLVVPPFSTTHHWAEIQVAGRWVPVDPVLIRAMLRWGVLDAAEWTPYRSPGAIFTRICPSGTDLVTHAGTARPVKLTLPTRRVTAGDRG